VREALIEKIFEAEVMAREVQWVKKKVWIYEERFIKKIFIIFLLKKNFFDKIFYILKKFKKFLFH
jgi:hypothetical protein